MWIVIDHNKLVVFGPFETKDFAEEWLAKQGVFAGQYEDNEVSIDQLKSTTKQLESI